MAHSANKLNLFDPSQLPADKNFLIAYSGGADSTALLHFLAHNSAFKGRIRAIHINHQLQKEADDWQSACEHNCLQWGIPLTTVRVTLSDDSENTARDARRIAFMDNIQSHEVLLTGHHQQDQAETVLFRLLRGTGLKGLSGIDERSQLPNGNSIVRPLLHLDKMHIIDYLHTHQLSWQEDPSNQSDRYSRNHIRNHILPSISNYDTKAQNAIAETANHLNQSHRLLMCLLPDSNPLPFEGHIDATFLHHWLQKKQLNPPSHHSLVNFIENCHQAAEHKHPELNAGRYRLLFWKGQVYLLKAKIKTESVTLPLDKIISLPCGGQLTFSCPLKNFELDIKYNVTGERLKRSQHSHHKAVKKLFQESQTPPWEKEITPFVYHADQLLAVGNWCNESLTQLLKQNNCQYSWQKAEQIL